MDFCILTFIFVASGDLIAAGEAGTYDFVFIDADKFNYDRYYEKSLELIRQGGIIAIDNVSTLYTSRICHAVVLRGAQQTVDCEQNETALTVVAVCLKVLWSGNVLNPAPSDLTSQSLDNLNKKLHKDQRIELSMLTIGDGLSIVIKR